MSEDSSDVVKKAQEYYNSSDADNFYFEIWGGEDIHIGLYQSDEDSIFDASARTVEEMGKHLSWLKPEHKLLDIGAGYGGSARHLVKRYGCQAVCLNLSEVQNERNRGMNVQQGLADKIDVVDGNFEALPFEANSFDAVWSQDAILHSGNRKTVFEEVDRVLKPGGEFIFTDPMQRMGVEPEILKPVLERIHLASMGSIDTYERYAQELGWESVEVVEMSEQLINHYSAVRANLESREAELKERVAEDYINRMKNGLTHWIEAGKKDALTWGILRFRKK